jgi:hypothetical protein
MSRPLLYMHLDRLEKADLVTGHLELSDDGKAMKYLELVPFELRVTAETVVDALAHDDDRSDDDHSDDPSDDRSADRSDHGSDDGSTDDGSGTQALETEQNNL